MNMLVSAGCDAPHPIVEQHVLGMAEMGYRGLSEQWLLRRMGDLHWKLIARAMGQAEAIFTGLHGEPLYAAFCTTSLRLFHSDIPRLGGDIILSSALYRIGQSRMASCVAIWSENHLIGQAVLISTFVAHAEPGRNRSIVRRTTSLTVMPPDAPHALHRIASHAASLSKNSLIIPPDLDNEVKAELLLPCPVIDFNAVGLLYFPSFSALADRALFQAGERPATHLMSRHVAYLSNVEPGEGVTVVLRKNRRCYNMTMHGEDRRCLAMMRVRFR